MVSKPKQHAPRQCATCGALFTPRPYAVARLDYCSQGCRLAVITVQRSPRPAQPIDQAVTRRSTPYGMGPKHEARCLHCGRVVLPSDGLLWVEAVRRQRCPDCRGSLLIEEQDSPGAGSGRAEAVRRFHTRYSQPTGRVA